MKKAIIVAGLLVGLGGCQTLMQQAAAECASIGIGPGHPHYAGCVQGWLDNNQRSSAALISNGLMMMDNSRPQPAVTCIRTGTFTRCQ